MESRALRFLAIAMLLALTAPSVFAKPNDWYQKGLNKNCYDHPSARVSKPSNPHGNPVSDSTISFSVKDSKKVATTTVCPGKDYAVKVSFPEKRSALFTSDVGTLATTDSTAKATTCSTGSHIVMGGDGQKPSTSITSTLSVPCSAKAGNVITLAVTSAKTSGSHTWQQASTTLTVASGCKTAATCKK